MSITPRLGLQRHRGLGEHADEIWCEPHLSPARRPFSQAFMVSRQNHITVLKVRVNPAKAWNKKTRLCGWNEQLMRELERGTDQGCVFDPRKAPLIVPPGLAA
jgi:hypothetical protein